MGSRNFSLCYKRRTNFPFSSPRRNHQTQSIPLFETVFTRYTIISILSVVWLRRTGQPLFSPVHIRNLLVIRSVTGFISLLGFIYSIQNLPLAYPVVLNLATPIMASIGAKIILQDNWALPDIGGTHTGPPPNWCTDKPTRHVLATQTVKFSYHREHFISSLERRLESETGVQLGF